MTDRDAVLDVLKRGLPPVTLLLGPRDRTRALAIDVVQSYGDPAFDVDRLDVEAARTVARDAYIAPFGARKTFIINLDKAVSQALNALLKLLEEPPARTRFILLASIQPLPTVLSRAQLYRVSGSPELFPGLEWDEKAQAAVSTALKAAMTGDSGLLSAATRVWEPVYGACLGRWALECATGRWQRFEPAFAPGATMAQARKLLVMLGQYSGRTGTIVALDQAFREA
jgi:hypothetical protein